MQSFQRCLFSVVGVCSEPPAATWIKQGEGRKEGSGAEGCLLSGEVCLLCCCVPCESLECRRSLL